MKQNKKILVVDDIELNRAILSQMFASEYQVCEASNGQEAIECIEKEKGNFSAILLDVIMPVMDGFGVLDYLTTKKLMNKIPVFLITADSSDDMTLRGYEMGVADVINKPFNAAIVSRRVDNVMELYRHR
ncbi:MAG: response regulator, partial [Oscillospiraceae bacterium]|nr:response regulator [Oscillospiraceae bacterium]